MKHILIVLTLFSCSPVFADETLGEKAGSKMNDAKREMKKSYHHGKEAVCAKGDVACMKDKAKHRGTEAKDYLNDKSSELKDKVD